MIEFNVRTYISNMNHVNNLINHSMEEILNSKSDKIITLRLDKSCRRCKLIKSKANYLWKLCFGLDKSTERYIQLIGSVTESQELRKHGDLMESGTSINSAPEWKLSYSVG